MSYSLKLLKEGYIGEYIGKMTWVIKGETRALDHAHMSVTVLFKSGAPQTEAGSPYFTCVVSLGSAWASI